MLPPLAHSWESCSRPGSLSHTASPSHCVSHTQSHPQTNSLSFQQTHTRRVFLTHSVLTLLQFPSRSRSRSHARLSPQEGAGSRAASLTCPRPAWPARGSRDCIPHAAPVKTSVLQCSVFFRYINQGKLEVVKQEMTRVNIDILGISKLKWTGMGEFNCTAC